MTSSPPSLVEVMARELCECRNQYNVPLEKSASKENYFYQANKIIDALCSALGCSIEVIEEVASGKNVIVRKTTLSGLCADYPASHITCDDVQLNHPKVRA